MKIFTILTISIMFVVSIIGCNQEQESPVLSIKISKDNLIEIKDKIEQDKNLSVFDIQYFNNGLTRLGIVPDTIIGMSVKDIINSQEDIQKNNANLLLNQTTTRIMMNMYYSVQYLGLQPMIDTINNTKATTILYEFKNQTDKTIVKVGGFIQFFNRNQQIIKQYEVENTQIIPADAAIKFYKAFAHDDKDGRDSIIRNFHTSLLTKWQPKYIEFSDSTKLSL